MTEWLYSSSRCAVLRFTRLLDAEILSRLQQVCAMENVSYDLNGLESIIFTAEGDMRNALNALQSTVSGFGIVTSENVFKVCDQPHPQKLKAAIERAREGKTAESMEIVMTLWGSGYAATDIIQTLFRVGDVLHFEHCSVLHSRQPYQLHYDFTNISPPLLLHCCCYTTERVKSSHTIHVGDKIENGVKIGGTSPKTTVLLPFFGLMVLTFN
jgi:Replication factor C C-terminal domain